MNVRDLMDVLKIATIPSEVTGVTVRRAIN